MSAAGFAEDFDWDQVPESVMEAFGERLHLVETLLDPQIEPAAKRAERRRYCQQHGVGERTVRGYLHRYGKKGARALLFYRRRPTSPRVHDPHLRAKIIALIDELPTRSVPQLRKLIAADHALHGALERHLRPHRVPLPGRERSHQERPLSHAGRRLTQLLPLLRGAALDGTPPG